MFKNQRKCLQSECLNPEEAIDPEPIAEARGQAPAKLILSGEHAVLYGAPALAIAIECRFVVTIRPIEGSGLHLKCPILGIDTRYTPEAILQVSKKSWGRYAEFEEGTRFITEVLEHRDSLLICALMSWLDQHSRTLLQGIQISIVSAIPVGYGLGSSAAGIVALWRALENYFGSYAAPEAFFKRAVSVEHLQHGVSSGVDIAVCQTEFPCLYYQERLEALDLPEFHHAWLVHTGRPEVSTGACVESVKKHFQNPDLVKRFEEVTLRLAKALMEDDEKNLIHAVSDNHRLLCQIGVVPEKIRRFIQQVESLGGAGKICGAGAIQGDNGGVAWVVGLPEKVLPVLEHFGYSYEPLRCAHHVASSVGG